MILSDELRPDRQGTIISGKFEVGETVQFLPFTVGHEVTFPDQRIGQFPTKTPYAIRWMRMLLLHLDELEALEVGVWESEGGATR